MNVKYIGCFAAGAGFGALVAVMTTKRKYELLANKEIEEARAHYNKKLSDMSLQNRTKTDISDLVNSVQMKHHDEPVDYSKYDTTTKEEPEVIVPHEEAGPVLTDISQDEFAEPNGYDKETVILYRDGVVAKADDDNLIDPDETTGTDILERIDGRTGDALYVRNESLIIDFEVTYDNRTYTEATGIYLKE